MSHGESAYYIYNINWHLISTYILHYSIFLSNNIRYHEFYIYSFIYLFIKSYCTDSYINYIIILFCIYKYVLVILIALLLHHECVFIRYYFFLFLFFFFLLFYVESNKIRKSFQIIFSQ